MLCTIVKYMVNSKKPRIFFITALTLSAVSLNCFQFMSSPITSQIPLSFLAAPLTMFAFNFRSFSAFWTEAKRKSTMIINLTPTFITLRTQFSMELLLATKRAKNLVHGCANKFDGAPLTSSFGSSRLYFQDRSPVMDLLAFTSTKLLSPVRCLKLLFASWACFHGRYSTSKLLGLQLFSNVVAARGVR